MCSQMSSLFPGDLAAIEARSAPELQPYSESGLSESEVRTCTPDCLSNSPNLSQALGFICTETKKRHLMVSLLLSDFFRHVYSTADNPFAFSACLLTQTHKKEDKRKSAREFVKIPGS